MATSKITEMTIDEIKVLIMEVVDERLRDWWQKSRDTRSTDEVLSVMDRLRWTPPSGAPTTTELLREERDR